MLNLDSIDIVHKMDSTLKFCLTTRGHHTGNLRNTVGWGGVLNAFHDEVKGKQEMMLQKSSTKRKQVLPYFKGLQAVKQMRGEIDGEVQSYLHTPRIINT